MKGKLDRVWGREEKEGGGENMKETEGDGGDIVMSRRERDVWGI